MNFEDKKYLYFYTLDYTGNYTTSGYTLPITPFTFVPVFDSGDGSFVSTTNIIWDFGDGTFSRELTATHSYSVPGIYNVTCFFYSTGGQGYESSFAQSIFVKDYISDTLALSAQPVNIIETSHYQNPFTLYRYNSWQTYPTLSSIGLTILLYASGGIAPLLDVDVYAKDKWSHLKPNCRFLAFEFDPILNTNTLVPVNEVTTINNDTIYVKLDENKNIVKCGAGDIGSTVAGTSGTRVVYFTSDLAKVPESSETQVPDPIFTFAYFDTTSLYDINSYGKNYPTIDYPIHHQIVSNWYVPTFILQKHIDHLSITSNGIDTEGTIINNSFEIQPNKFINQKIPIVIKAKDSSNYTAKSSHLMRLSSVTTDTNSFVDVKLVDSNNNVLTEGVTVYEDFGSLSALSHGGFFKGYFISTQPYENVRLFATGQLSGADYFIIPTANGVIAQPQSRMIHKINITRSANLSSITLSETQISTPSLTGVYDTCVVPYQDNNTGVVEYFMWVADADNDIIAKYSQDGVLIFESQLPDGSSPAGMVGDGDGNIWVTLFDSVSTVKLDKDSGTIIGSAVPPVANNDWDSYNLYTTLSGFAGGNSIEPTGIDIDIHNNVYISYTHPLSSFICKYNTTGTVLSTFSYSNQGLWSPDEILVDVYGTVWAIYKYHQGGVGMDFLKGYYANGTTTPDITLSTLSYYTNPNADLWDMTLDANQNIWITANDNQVIKFNTSDLSWTSFRIHESPSVGPDVPNFTGIACTTNNTILVVDDTHKKIHYFNSNEVVYTNTEILLAVNSFDVDTPTDIAGAVVQNNLNGFGDWTGFRYINKFFHHFGLVPNLQAYSNTFSIYPTDGKYKISKINENFDATAQFKSNIFQETLLDQTRLIDDFIGSAIGDITSSPNVLGKRIYEKIANFSDNISYIDTCNVQALEAMYALTNNTFYKQHSYEFASPANLARLIDLFSIKFSRLRGSRNKFDENFDLKGTTPSYLLSNSLSGTAGYGKNIGRELDINTTTIPVGVSGNYIVAYERFSNQYTKIHTYLNPHFVYSQGYYDGTTLFANLLGYEDNWNWGLVLPVDYIYGTLGQYYTFYEYVSGANDKQVSGVINWGDALTTITESVTSVSQWNAVVENMLTHALAEGTGILST